MSIDFSLIICAYNPDERLLKRCLDAISNLKIDNILHEVILVDNNSLVPVRELACVTAHIGTMKNMRVIHEPRQGVSFARIAAIQKAAGEHIVYIDFDNEPESDYLLELKKLNGQYNHVAAWGPGNVWVDFIDGIDPVIECYARTAFQERHELHITYANIREWQPFYPFGTGLCMKTSLLKEYVELAQEGKYTMPGRMGNKLSGGEDTQMVLHCIRKGFAAGVSPSLKLKHIIPAGRANISYLKRFAYGVALDYKSCLLQVFPEHEAKIKELQLSESAFSRKVVKKFLQLTLSSDPHAALNLLGYIGFHAGIYRALEKPVPKIVSRVIKKLKAE